jgi:hypothetical protein
VDSGVIVRRSGVAAVALLALRDFMIRDHREIGARGASDIFSAPSVDDEGLCLSLVACIGRTASCRSQTLDNKNEKD